MKTEKTAYEGEWDFDGAHAPAEDGPDTRRSAPETFSLGCFQWVRRGRDGNGTGLKKGKVMYRIKGVTANPKPAFESARAYCRKKNDRQRT